MPGPNGHQINLPAAQALRFVAPSWAKNKSSKNPCLIIASMLVKITWLLRSSPYAFVRLYNQHIVGSIFSESRYQYTNSELIRKIIFLRARAFLFPWSQDSISEDRWRLSLKTRHRRARGKRQRGMEVSRNLAEMGKSQSSKVVAATSRHLV
jgi:hypothetical protein